MEITITETKGTELYCRYDRELKPQTCYLNLDPRDGSVCCDYSGEIGNSVPMDVYHGLRLQWRIPALKAEAANRLMHESEPLFVRICGGFKEEWDGHNMVGKLSEDAEQASSEIESAIEALNEDEHLVVWEAGDYFSALGNAQRQAEYLGVKPDSNLDEIESRLEKEALSEGVDALEGLSKFLEQLQEELREAAEEESQRPPPNGGGLGDPANGQPSNVSVD